MTAQELLNKITQQKQEVSALKGLWESLFPEYKTPADRQFYVWLNRHDDLEIISTGLATATQWYQQLQALVDATDAGMPILNKNGDPVPIYHTKEAMQKQAFVGEICSYASACMIRDEKKAKEAGRGFDIEEGSDGQA